MIDEEIINLLDVNLTIDQIDQLFKIAAKGNIGTEKNTPHREKLIQQLNVFRNIDLGLSDEALAESLKVNLETLRNVSRVEKEEIIQKANSEYVTNALIRLKRLVSKEYPDEKRLNLIAKWEKYKTTMPILEDQEKIRRIASGLLKAGFSMSTIVDNLERDQNLTVNDIIDNIRLHEKFTRSKKINEPPEKTEETRKLEEIRNSKEVQQSLEDLNDIDPMSTSYPKVIFALLRQADKQAALEKELSVSQNAADYYTKQMIYFVEDPEDLLFLIQGQRELSDFVSNEMAIRELQTPLQKLQEIYEKTPKAIENLFLFQKNKAISAKNELVKEGGLSEEQIKQLLENTITLDQLKALDESRIIVVREATLKRALIDLREVQKDNEEAFNAVMVAKVPVSRHKEGDAEAIVGTLTDEVPLDPVKPVIFSPAGRASSESDKNKLGPTPESEPEEGPKPRSGSDRP